MSVFRRCRGHSGAAPAGPSTTMVDAGHPLVGSTAVPSSGWCPSFRDDVCAGGIAVAETRQARPALASHVRAWSATTVVVDQ